MEATSLDIAKAYRNSPISPKHKKSLCVLWKGGVYVQHVAIKGLATAGGIQGCIADVTLAILKFHGIEPAIKWVNDFVFFRVPFPVIGPPPAKPVFKFDLSMILALTTLLGIPWHPILKKGHDFSTSFSYVGFDWNLPSQSVSLSNDKRLQLLDKVTSIISSPST